MEIRQEKEIEGTQIQKKEVKLFVDDKFYKVVGYKVNMQVTCFSLC